jgi:hypothetical protein
MRGDTCDTAQILTFVGGIYVKFEITEKLTLLQSLEGTTGDDIFLKLLTLFTLTVKIFGAQRLMVQKSWLEETGVSLSASRNALCS